MLKNLSFSFYFVKKNWILLRNILCISFGYSSKVMKAFMVHIMTEFWALLFFWWCLFVCQYKSGYGYWDATHSYFLQDGKDKQPKLGEQYQYVWVCWFSFFYFFFLFIHSGQLEWDRWRMMMAMKPWSLGQCLLFRAYLEQILSYLLNYILHPKKERVFL